MEKKKNKKKIKLQLFSEAEQLKPSGHFWVDLAGVPKLAKWPA